MVPWPDYIRSRRRLQTVTPIYSRENRSTQWRISSTAWKGGEFGQKRISLGKALENLQPVNGLMAPH